MEHRTDDVLAGVTDAWLEEVGDAAGGGQGDHDARRAAQEAEEGSALSARRSPGGPAFGSDTESEDGLRDYLAAASRSAHDSNDELLRTPTRRAESSLPDRSGTPVAVLQCPQARRQSARLLLAVECHTPDRGGLSRRPSRG